MDIVLYASINILYILLVHTISIVICYAYASFILTHPYMKKDLYSLRFIIKFTLCYFGSSQNKSHALFFTINSK